MAPRFENCQLPWDIVYYNTCEYRLSQKERAPPKRKYLKLDIDMIYKILGSGIQGWVSVFT